MKHKHKNIKRHAAHTIVSWPNPKQWVIVRISDLMMITRQRIYVPSIITKQIVKLKTHSPTYCIVDNWEHAKSYSHTRQSISDRHTTPYIIGLQTDLTSVTTPTPSIQNSLWCCNNSVIASRKTAASYNVTSCVILTMTRIKTVWSKRAWCWKYKKFHQNNATCRRTILVQIWEYVVKRVKLYKVQSLFDILLSGIHLSSKYFNLFHLYCLCFPEFDFVYTCMVRGWDFVSKDLRSLLFTPNLSNSHQTLLHFSYLQRTIDNIL